MTGATQGQQELGAEQMQAYQQAQQLTQQQYGNQQAIYAPMASQFQAIFAKGPNQEGFSAPEKQNLNSQVLQGTAANYADAAKAVNENEAAMGGGNNPMEGGAEEQQKENVAESSAAEESGEENQVNQADYQQGYNEWEAAGAGLNSIAAGENPLGYESEATGAGSAAGTTQQQIANEQNSWINAAIGAAGSIGGAAVKGFSGGGGSGGGGGWSGSASSLELPGEFAP